MIVTQENQRLYPATWEYNAARIITELAKIVEDHGGRVKYGHAALISNRSISGAIFEKEQRAEKLKELNAENKKEKIDLHIQNQKLGCVLECCLFL